MEKEEEEEAVEEQVEVGVCQCESAWLLLSPLPLIHSRLLARLRWVQTQVLALAACSAASVSSVECL